MRALNQNEEVLLAVAEARRSAFSHVRALTVARAAEGRLVDAMLTSLPTPVPPNRVEMQLFLLEKKIRTIRLTQGAVAIEVMLSRGHLQALSSLGIGVSDD